MDTIFLCCSMEPEAEQGCVTGILLDVLVYGITNGDGSGYNRNNGVQLNTKSKVEGAITNEEYRSPEA